MNETLVGDEKAREESKSENEGNKKRL